MHTLSTAHLLSAGCVLRRLILAYPQQAREPAGAVTKSAGRGVQVNLKTPFRLPDRQACETCQIGRLPCGISRHSLTPEHACLSPRQPSKAGSTAVYQTPLSFASQKDASHRVKPALTMLTSHTPVGSTLFPHLMEMPLTGSTMPMAALCTGLMDRSAALISHTCGDGKCASAAASSHMSDCRSPPWRVSSHTSSSKFSCHTSVVCDGVHTRNTNYLQHGTRQPNPYAPSLPRPLPWPHQATRLAAGSKVTRDAKCMPCAKPLLPRPTMAASSHTSGSRFSCHA